MKRPIFIITLGFVSGIVGGLYLKIVPLFICLLLFLVFIIVYTKSNIINIFKRNKSIYVFLISIIISGIWINFYEFRYEQIYKKLKSETLLATVISDVQEKEYFNKYIIKVGKSKNKIVQNKCFILQTPKSIKLEFGNEIKIQAEYIEPEQSRNYKGFDYKEYLKTQKIYGTFKTNNIYIIKEENINTIEKILHKIKTKIINNMEMVFNKDTKDLFLGMLIGHKDNISDDLKEDFRKSSLSHILAISGDHISYVILTLTILGELFKIPKRINNVLISIFLILFIYITGYTSSVIRAAIMGSIIIGQILIYRKQDTITTISLSILIMLCENPYRLFDLGFILSYLATIGIVYYTKILKEHKKSRTKILDSILITLAANLFIIPIVLYNFNTLSLNFIISNLIASVLMKPIIVGGIIIIIISFLSIKISKICGFIYNYLLKILILNAKITSKIPFSNLIVTTPSILLIIVYYILLIIIIFLIYLKNMASNRYLARSILGKIGKMRKYIIHNFKKIIIFIAVIIITINQFKYLPNELKLYFIDVGQGDSTLIITPKGKKILIDGGGNDGYSIGKKLLLPYLLDRKIKEIDYMIISHFDTDHCDGLLYLIEQINVKNIIIGNQYEQNDNYRKFLNLIKKNKNNIIIAKMEEKILIEENVYIDILWPSLNNSIYENSINNNSIVCKLSYKNFSVLFTGDIEEVAEKELIHEIGDLNILKSTVLKVAHHGSKTSSTKEFLNAVNAKYALIGVGKNNKFGHPSDTTIENLNKTNTKIFRTDEMGEIEIKTNGKKIKFRTHIHP